MAYVSAIRVAFEPLRSLAFDELDPAFVAIGTPYLNPMRIIKISNDTNVNIIVSFDGVTDHDFVAAGGFTLYDFESNKEEPAGKLTQSKGTQVYVREESAIASSGNVYLTTVYGYTTG